MDTDAHSSAVERTLARPDVHETWESAYYRAGNDDFYERAFDDIVRYLRAPPGATILDAGCGQGYHSLRLAKRGFRVEAVDFSPAVLEVAAENVTRAGQADVIHVHRENLVDLSFADESFRYVLCWGVLMHIPLVEKAIAELCRVVKRDGVVVVSEANSRSLDAVGARLLRTALRKRAASVSADSGIETWIETPAGPLMTRQTNVGWLEREFGRHGMQLERRRAAEFTEAYTKFHARRVVKAIHLFNLFWFSSVKNDRIASGGILFFRKSS